MGDFAPNSKEYHRLCLDSLSNGVLIAQMLYNDQNQPVDAVILEVNSAFASTVGQPKEGLVGRRATDFHPGIGPKWLGESVEVMERGVSKRWEQYNAELGGWFEFLSTPLEGGKFAVMLTDVNERKDLLRQLRESESRYRKLFETANDGFWWIDKHGQIIETNEDLARMLGCSQAELLGRPWANFIDTDWLEAAREHWQAAKLGETRRCELKLRRRDGSSIWVRASSSPLRDEAGQFPSVLVAFKDVEEQKIAEKQVLALVSELEAENENKNEFISMLAHELRNPLAIIMAAAELLELSDHSEQDLQTIETLKRQVGHLSQLVDGLLDITRITRRVLSLDKNVVKINAIVTDIINDLKPRFADKNISLTADICPEPIFVDADVVRMTQCIGNVLANAMKYTPPQGTVSLELKAENESAVIIVRDTGMGIQPGVLGEIFEPYLQGPSDSGDHNSRGLGLGLYIVKSIMEMHGGEVYADSLGPGQGSVFTLRLPIRR